jgi:hypothetical protein
MWVQFISPCSLDQRIHSKSSEITWHTWTPFVVVFQFDHNGLIFMDATFGTNNVKYQLFTLMEFDFHHTKVLVAWVITSKKTSKDLVEWLNALRTKLLLHMPN